MHQILVAFTFTLINTASQAICLKTIKHGMEKLRQRSFFKITLEYVSGKINKSSKPLLFTTDAVYLIQGHFIVLTFVHFLKLT